MAGKEGCRKKGSIEHSLAVLALNIELNWLINFQSPSVFPQLNL